MLIFEDGKNAPVSLLIKYLLGDHVDFSEGNEFLIKCANSHLDSVVHILVDVSPDYNKTADIHDQVVDYFSNAANVTVHKIPCIEFFVLQLLIQNKTFVYEASLASDYVKSLCGESISYNQKSYERFCKAVLNHQLVCTRNRRPKVSHPGFGLYYAGNCYCPSKISGKYQCSAMSKSREEKALQLLRFLPVVPFGLDSSDLSTQIDTYIDKSEQVIAQLTDSLYSRITRAITS